MHIRGWIVAPVLCAVAASAQLVACTGDDVEIAAVDGGTSDASPRDGAALPDSAPTDGGSSDAADSAPTLTRRLLATQQVQKGELVAIDPAKGSVDGRLAFEGFGYVEAEPSAAWLIESSADRVALLDPSQPWLVRASWNVSGSDAFDGGESYADPVQVVSVSPTKAYVLRFNRNAIAVIDPSKGSDAGAAASYVDLSKLLQTGDSDGHIDMTGGFFDAKRGRLYVALGNIDLHNVDPNGFFQLCGSTKSTLIAIDVATDKLVDLGGGQPGGGVALNGVSPQMGVYGGLVYDAVGDRLLVLSTGCNLPVTDGGVGALKGRIVESVSLVTSASTTLLDLAAQDFPGQLTYVDSHTAYLQIGYGPWATVYRWDPATTTLGAPLGSAPDVYAFAKSDNALLGPRTMLASDGGILSVDAVRASLAPDAGAPTVIAKSPFSASGGFLGNAALFPPSN